MAGRIETSVILPTYNESEHIRPLVHQCLEHVKDVEVIVVDDNSPDGTGRIADELAAKHPEVRVIHREKPTGLGSAILTGVKDARGEHVVWMDADLCMPPRLIPVMIERMSRSDVVIGSRYAPGGKDARDASRVLTSLGINMVATLLLPTGKSRIRDWTTGFVAVKRSVFDAVGGFDPEGHGEYCIEFLYNCVRHGYRVEEVGYVFTERTSGASKTTRYVYSLLIHGYKYIRRILRSRFSS